MEIDKDRIRRILWERDFIKDLQRGIVDRAVASYKAECIGTIPIESDITKKAEIQTRNNVFHAVIKMLTAYMMNFVYEKCIDEIINIIEE